MSLSPTPPSPPPPVPGSPVPFFELGTQWPALRQSVNAAIQQVLESQQYTSGATSGKFIGAFEEALGKTVGAHVVGLSSGTDAILGALMALNIGGADADGGMDEIITTPFTFFATAGCVVRAGARPVFVDIDPETFLIDLKRIPSAITGRTVAILPVHLFGQMVDMTALAALAKEHNLDIVEDAAQAIGARDPSGRQIAELGTCACLSFYPTKNLGAAGDAGALVTRDAALAQRFFQTRQHGETARYHHEFVGGNFRMDALQAAVLTVKLGHLENWTKRRRAIADHYSVRFKGSDARPPALQPGAGLRHVYHQYVIRVPRRDALREHLTKLGIGCNVFYPKGLHLQACFADLGYKAGQFPHTEKATQEVLALPVYPELTDAQIEQVATAVLGFYK